MDKKEEGEERKRREETEKDGEGEEQGAGAEEAKPNAARDTSPSLPHLSVCPQKEVNRGGGLRCNLLESQLSPALLWHSQPPKAISLPWVIYKIKHPMRNPGPCLQKEESPHMLFVSTVSILATPF